MAVHVERARAARRGACGAARGERRAARRAAGAQQPDRSREPHALVTNGSPGMTETERRTGQLLPRAENGVASGGLRIDGSSALTTTYGAPVAKVATVPRPALSLWPCLCGARNRLRDL